MKPIRFERTYGTRVRMVVERSSRTGRPRGRARPGAWSRDGTHADRGDSWSIAWTILLDEIAPVGSTEVEIRIRQDLDSLKEPKSRRRFKKLFLAALESVPWVGGFLSGLGSLRADEKQGQGNELHREWLEEHGRKFVHLGQTLAGITDRLEQFGEEVQERIETRSISSSSERRSARGIGPIPRKSAI